MKKIFKYSSINCITITTIIVIVGIFLLGLSSLTYLDFIGKTYKHFLEETGYYSSPLYQENCGGRINRCNFYTQIEKLPMIFALLGGLGIIFFLHKKYSGEKLKKENSNSNKKKEIEKKN